MRLLRLFAPLALATAVAGCSGPAVCVVTGKVTLNDKAVTGGSVSAVVNGVSFSGDITPGGTYTIADVPVGDAVFLVFDPPQPAHAGADEAGGGKNQGRELPKPAAKPAARAVVPAKYGQQTTSDLKKPLTKGTNTVDLKLTP